MTMPSRVTVVEVGPRDGFQMEREFIPTEMKVEIINAISRTGIKKLEATSFVNPKVIPQMADAAQVMQSIDRAPGVSYTALVPNLKGARRAVEARVDGLRLVVCASESYNQRNIGQSVDESLREFETVLGFAREAHTPTDAAVGLSFGCPLEGDVPPQKVVQLVRRIVEIGFGEICIADSIGLANPIQVRRLMQQLLDEFPSVAFSLHIHDTRGLGLANVLAALEEGIAAFDSSIGGLGGCPIVPGATGNVATEDLVNMLNEMGVETGIDTHKVVECSRAMQDFLGRTLPSHVLQAGTRTQLYESGSPHRLC